MIFEAPISSIVLDCIMATAVLNFLTTPVTNMTTPANMPLFTISSLHTTLHTDHRVKPTPLTQCLPNLL